MTSFKQWAVIPVLLILAVTVAWIRLKSDAGAVPAGANHAADVNRVTPDGRKDDPKAAENFTAVKVMLRGYCHAGSRIADSKAPGGFWKSDNHPKRVGLLCKGRGLYLMAQPQVVTHFGEKPGMRLVLVNRTDELLAFKASDSRLSIVQEAQDESGRWRPVEYLPSSWCGNSYHRVFLPAGQFWEFPAPRYKGSLGTKLRFVLTLAEGSQVVSNTFEGSVNPEQFTVKEGHVPQGVMDPYLD